MATYVTLSVNAQDIIGADFDRSRCSVWLETNTDHGLVVVDTSTVRLGGRRESPDADGVVTFANLVATNSATNPTSFGYRVKIIYTPKGSRKQGHDELVTSEFPLTTSKNLADIPEAWDNVTIPVSWRSDFMDQAQALLDAQTAIAGLTGEDAAIANRVNTGGSLTDIAVRAKIEAGLAPSAVVNKRHPLTAAFHVESYGAKGDGNGTTGVGATNNLPALNAIVAAILARPDKSGRIIFGPGNFWLNGDGWIIDGENVEVECHPNTLIYTTSATATLGGVVSFLGYGNLSSPANGGTGDPAENLVPTPQRERFTWRGGRIKATGSGGMDNGLGPTRVKNVHISDVIIDADRKALSAQYGIDNIVWERIVIKRGDLDGITIETACKRINLRDITVEQTNGIGVRITSGLVGGSPIRNTEVLLDNVNVLADGGVAFSVSLSDRVSLRKCKGAGSLSLPGSADKISIAGDCSFSDITYGTGLTFATPRAVPCTLNTANSWVVAGGSDLSPEVVRSADGMVTLTGCVKNGSTTANQTIITLPRGYRPAVRVRTNASTPGGSPYALPCYIEPDGTVKAAVTITSTALICFGATFAATATTA